MTAQAEPTLIKILRLIRDEGPISSRKIIEKLEIKPGAAYPLISLLRLLGLIDYWSGENMWKITEYGKQCPALKEGD